MPLVILVVFLLYTVLRCVCLLLDEDSFAWGNVGITAGSMRFRELPALANGKNQHPILLIHGWGVTAACFKGAALALHRRTGRRIVGVDLPGCGRSHGPAAYSPREQAEAVLAFCDDRGIEAFDAAGHSGGCAVVAHMQALAPARVHRQIRISPNDNTAGERWGLERRGARRIMSAADVFRRFTRVPFRETSAVLLYAAPSYLREGFWHLLMTYIFMASASEDVPQPPDPVLVITGDRDPLTDREHLARLADAGAISHHVVPGPHGIYYNAAEEVALIIASWVGAC